MAAVYQLYLRKRRLEGTGTEFLSAFERARTTVILQEKMLDLVSPALQQDVEVQRAAKGFRNEWIDSYFGDRILPEPELLEGWANFLYDGLNSFMKQLGSWARGPSS